MLTRAKQAQVLGAFVLVVAVGVGGAGLVEAARLLRVGARPGRGLAEVVGARVEVLAGDRRDFALIGDALIGAARVLVVACSVGFAWRVDEAVWHLIEAAQARQR